MNTLNLNLRLASPIGTGFFWTAVIVTGILTPGYSHIDQAVSELGAIGTPYPWLINWFGIIPFAISMVITSYFIIRDLPPGILKWLSGIALFIGGLGFILAGLMQCDIDCRQSELTSAKLHELGAGIGFQLLPIASLFLGIRFFRETENRSIYIFSLMMTLGMIAGIVLFLGALDPTRSLGGIWQRLILVFISIWISGISIYFFQQKSKKE